MHLNKYLMCITSTIITIIILFSNIIVITSATPVGNRIKKCEYSSLCIELLQEVSIEVFFNVAPKSVTQGELVFNTNSTIKYISKPTITKENTIIFKFTPQEIGSYSFHFNKDLKCPMNHPLIVKQSFKMLTMPKSLFVSENLKMTEQTFNMNFMFDYDIFLNKDKGDIRQFAIAETGTEKDMIYKSLDNCIISPTNNKEIICNGIKEIISGNSLGFYYYDRCNTRNTLGFLTIVMSSSFKQRQQSKPSLLGKLYSHYINQYQKDKIILVTFVISSQKKGDLDILNEVIAPLANEYPDFIITFADWEQDTYMTHHFNLVNDGYVKIVIYDFSNENLYVQNYKNEEHIKSVMEELSNNVLEWTSQNLLRSIISKIGIKVHRDKEHSYYVIFCSFCFFFLIVLKCYLANRKRITEPAPAFAYKSKKTD